mmetsp:Transcript_13470/g.30569  ORF Transcript_13470/g.30569 Transcript_13470/m.30569 type:complete len:201 (+) Transcript_13470:548-1150(+)
MPSAKTAWCVVSSGTPNGPMPSSCLELEWPSELATVKSVKPNGDPWVSDSASEVCEEDPSDATEARDARRFMSSECDAPSTGLPSGLSLLVVSAGGCLEGGSEAAWASTSACHAPLRPLLLSLCRSEASTGKSSRIAGAAQSTSSGMLNSSMVSASARPVLAAACCGSHASVAGFLSQLASSVNSWTQRTACTIGKSSSS